MVSLFGESGILSAVSQMIPESLKNVFQDEIRLILDAEEELRKLKRSRLRIQAWVDYIEGQHFGNEARQVWLHDLRSVSLDVEDLLDEIDIMGLNSDEGTQVRDMFRYLPLFCSSLKSLKIPRRIGELRKKVEDMLGEVDMQFVIERVTKRQTDIPHSSSLVDPLSVIGRGRDKEELVQMLLGEESGLGSGSGSGGAVSVIPIVGMGGIGKTTLAQVVYNDDSIAKFFDLRVWVSVSVEYDTTRITRSIVESVTRERFKLSDLDMVQVRLQDVLRGKRFLLVLDDIWNENPTDWDVLQRPFNVGRQGSKVLVTTRSSVVWSMVTATAPRYLKPLSNEDCWKLIAERALSNRNYLDEKENLVAIGKKIAEKCSGLPLAAKTIGSVLHFKSTKNEWEALLESKLWDYSEAKNEIFPALILSYDHLSAPLKRCFAYCSIFPYKFEFEKHDLVHLWVAEGFIQPQGMRRIEDIGNEYFDKLFSRCFFHTHVNDLNEQVYQMHSLIHDLAQLVSVDMCFQMEEGMSSLSSTFKNVRHLTLLYQDIQPITLKVFERCKYLRTFMVLSRNRYRKVQFPYELFPKLSYIRVLNLSNTDISEVPDSVENLKLLRYLNLSETNIKELPESITKLYGLETLKLKNCSNFLRLPQHMKNLVKLRHLDLDIDRDSSMPTGLGKLTCLQTLHAFNVGKDEGCKIGELKNMTHLHGTISIRNLENVFNLSDAEEAMLDKKPYLDKLELEWNEPRDGTEVIKGLRPHDMLKELKVTNFSGMLPSWISECMLVSIYLHKFQECTSLPPLGHLPALKDLTIDEMHDMKYVERDFSVTDYNHVVSCFPSLESLKFRDMPDLEIWRGLMATDMPRLRNLTVEECPKLASLPSLHFLSSLEKLEISRCPELQSLPDGELPCSLKTLTILDSAILKERCKWGRGADWSKIRDVPKIVIDYVEIHLEGGVIPKNKNIAKKRELSFSNSGQLSVGSNSFVRGGSSGYVGRGKGRAQGSGIEKFIAEDLHTFV